VFFRQIEIVGSTMGPKGDLFPVLQHVAAGRLKPVVDRVMPLGEAQPPTGCSRTGRSLEKSF